MSWTYSGDPASSLKDAVRFEVQDIDESAPLLQDEEIEYALVEESDVVLSASAHCCEALARRFGMQADSQLGSVKETYSKQAAGFLKMAEALRRRAQGMHAPFAGGLSASEKRSLRNNPDRVGSPFRLGQFHRERGDRTAWD